MALEGINSEQALKFIQSFSLSPYSCSRLLDILNNTEINSNDEEKYSCALPFVRAYKLKGVVGTEKVN